MQRQAEGKPVNPGDEQYRPPQAMLETHELCRLYDQIRERAHLNGMGPAPLSWQDLHAFQSVTGTRLNGWTRRVLGWIDSIWLDETLKRQKEREKQGRR